MNDLIRKLGIKPGQLVCMLDAPSESRDDLRALIGQQAEVSILLERDRCYDQILFWPQTLDGLVERFVDLQHQIVPDGSVWAIIPKKKFAAGRNIQFTWEELQAAGLQTDLVDNKIASVSDQDYGTRFVIRKEHRRKDQLC